MYWIQYAFWSLVGALPVTALGVLIMRWMDRRYRRYDV